MIANAIMYATPAVKIYQALPPNPSELDEVMAVIFIGHTVPTEDEYKRSPLLVRREKVCTALEWLKLNHCQYNDLEISKDNLDKYPLNGVPVIVDFRYADKDEDPTNKLQSEMSVHDNEINIATSEGRCPFIVHGITESEYHLKL